MSGTISVDEQLRNVVPGVGGINGRLVVTRELTSEVVVIPVTAGVILMDLASMDFLVQESLYDLVVEMLVGSRLVVDVEGRDMASRVVELLLLLLEDVFLLPE